jgi:DNA-binding XRE family transcriptional regulator
MTQVDLAERADVSRQLIAAVEGGQNAPSVDAAIRLARVLGAPVEELFANEPSEWKPISGGRPQEGDLVLAAVVGRNLVTRTLDPREVTGASWTAPDGVIEDGTVRLFPGADPRGFLVLGCDPALGVIEGLSPRRGPQRIVGVSATTGMALEALAGERAHAALVHAAPGHFPDAPVPVHRVHLARWRVGVALRHARVTPGVEAILASSPRLVQREESASSQHALVRAAQRLAVPLPSGPIASGHLDAARRGRASGVPALTMEPASVAWGLTFTPLETHAVELWIAEQWLDHPGAAALVNLLSFPALRVRLGALRGYDLDEIGALRWAA